MSDTYTIQNTLPSGYRLLWYEIISLLGQGAFGVTYLAFDTNLQRKVAIKEFMPLEFSSRDHADSTVHPLTRKHEEIYHWGLERFMTEARTLARFKHLNIVKVYTVFEQNNTAYMVMEYEQGVELSQLFKRGQMTREAELLSIIAPLLEGLSLVHAEHFIHRDIKPANIYIRENGSPVLIDFGSARQAFGDKTQALTALVTSGFAPYEQYYQSEEHQGPWTDIYALGATAYQAITGKAPTDALVRGRSLLINAPDPLTPAIVAGAGRYSPPFLAAIDQALRFKEADRPQSTDEFKQMLLGEIAFRAYDDEKSAFYPNMRARRSGYNEEGKKENDDNSFFWLNIVFVTIVIALIASAGMYAYFERALSWRTIYRLSGLESKPSSEIEINQQEQSLHERNESINNMHQPQTSDEVKIKQGELRMLQQSLEHAKASLEKAKGDADQVDAKSRAATAYLSAENLTSQAIQLILAGDESLNKKQNYDEAQNTFHQALQLITEATESYTDARYEADRQIRKEARIKEKRLALNTLENALEQARRKLRATLAKADSIDTATYAPKAYGNAQQLSEKAKDIALKAWRHKNSADYNEALKTAAGAITLYNRATLGLEEAYAIAKKRIAENSQPIPGTQENLEKLF